MSWTVPTGCYYAVGEDDPQWHWVYYGAGATVPTEHAPNNPYVDERDLQWFILIDFTNGYIYTGVEYCTITIKSNNTFTVAYGDYGTIGYNHTNIIASSEALAQYHLTLAGVAFNFGNGSGMMNKSALLHSSRSYKMRFSFAGRSITSATIPSGIETLWHAFEGCTSLTTVSAIPSVVTDMGYCFQGCTSLTTAPTIPSSVIYLNHCFKDCTSLTTAPTITTPSAIIKMGYCFQGCTSLTTAPTIPSNVERMGYCFQGCTSLITAPTIPASVAYLNHCFKDCISLEGAVTINASPSDITDVFANTVNDIVLLGAGSLESIASSYENVYVWSLSTMMTASRDETQTTTVEISVDVSRFKTGTLASLTLSKDGTTQSVTWNDPTLAVTDIPTTFTTSLTNIGESGTPLLSVVATDAYGSSTVTSVRIPVAFYTIDVQAGGQEIAFGSLADDDLTNYPNGLFKCNMDALLAGSTTEVENPYYSLDTTASPGTTDGDLYAAITALGWENDVIDVMLDVKALLTKTLKDTNVVQSGATGAISVNSSSYADKTITFSPAFKNTPAISATFWTSSTGGTFGRCAVAIVSVSNTGATIRVFNGDTTSRSPNVLWTAIGK